MQIHELRLVATDLDAQQQFYGDRFNLPIERDADRLVVTVGNSRLVFTLRMLPPDAAYHVAFNIPPHQFDAAVVWLAARVPLLADPLGATTFAFPTWDADSVYCYDAAGNILELIARRTLQAPEARLFDAQSLLTISEVGLVTPDVDATIAWVQAQLPAPEYRSTRSPDFAALGDEHGLLIVAQTGREWYPSTGKRAVPAPLTIIASAGGGAPVTLVGPPWGEA